MPIAIDEVWDIQVTRNGERLMMLGHDSMFVRDDLSAAELELIRCAAMTIWRFAGGQLSDKIKMLPSGADA